MENNAYPPLPAMRVLVWLCALFGLSQCFAGTAWAQESAPIEQHVRTAQIVQIDGPIGPATADYISEAFETAREKNAELIILLMDTPGGLADSMRTIIKAILDSPIPVAGYVYPSGAHAASAGTYILYASHVAAMAPGTNLGAATPVQIGSAPPERGPEEGQPEGREPVSPGRSRGSAMEEKMINDSVAYIRSLAQLRGRNEEWAAQSVTHAASLPVETAVREKVVDLSAINIEELLEKIDGFRVSVRGQEMVLQTRGLSMERIEPGWLNRVLSVVTNPNVALMLMMIGFYGLIFEFANPGSIGPGVIGVISLLLGLYALNVLPLNYTGLVLLILGVALMSAEAFIPSFGVLGIGGIVAFMIGAAILIDTDAPGFRLSWSVIIATAAVSGGFLIFIIGYVWRTHRRPVSTGQAALIGREARVLQWSGDSGYVDVFGERWKARSGGSAAPGERVKVIDIKGLTLIIERSQPSKKGVPDDA
jgi:membrane-bound serine protease (ClpP class)